MANQTPKKRFFVEGNNGSYIFIETINDETVYLKVRKENGFTTDQKIKITELAILLTQTLQPQRSTTGE